MIQPAPSDRRSAARRGGTLGGVLLTLTILGTLSVATMLVAPRYLAADPPAPSATPAAVSGHQRVIDDLASLIAHSVGVLAVHQRGVTPYEEVVLWLTDDDPGGADGRADDPEVAVLSHSAVLQTITLYRRGSGGEREMDVSDRVSRTSPVFCDLWRADGRVTTVVLATGVSDMRVEPVGDPQHEWGAWGRWGDLQRLRLTLTWAADSADGPDEASVLVDTVVFGSGAGP